MLLNNRNKLKVCGGLVNLKSSSRGDRKTNQKVWRAASIRIEYPSNSIGERLDARASC